MFQRYYSSSRKVKGSGEGCLINKQSEQCNSIDGFASGGWAVDDPWCYRGVSIAVPEKPLGSFCYLTLGLYWNQFGSREGLKKNPKKQQVGISNPEPWQIWNLMK